MKSFSRSAALALACLSLPVLPVSAQGGGSGFPGGGGSTTESAPQTEGGGGGFGGGLGGRGFPGGGGGGGFDGGFGGTQTVNVPLYEQNSAVKGDVRFSLLRKQIMGVELKNARLSSIARYLTEKSGITIVVDKNADSDVLVSLSADRVPLATLLELIAQQADLMITPEPAREGHGAGVRFGTWPGVKVNDQTTIYKGANVPWSDEWGKEMPKGQPGLPGADEKAMQFPLDPGLGVPGPKTAHPFQAGGANSRKGRGDQFPFGFSAQGTGGLAGGGGEFGALPTPVANIAPLGDRMIAVAEAGTGPKGEPGILLTAYRFEGSRFKKVGSTFHRFARASPGGFGGSNFF